MTDSDPGALRVVLVGFMASGKTSVGRRLARLLDWTFADFDAEIEAEAGASIPEIFADQGEDSFRALEARVGRRLLQRENVVLATGGGWAAAKGRLTDLPDGTLTVWLRVGPEEAVRRVGNEAADRPLLDVADPVDRARELLDEREPSYGRAHVTLDTEDHTPEELARAIAELVTNSSPEPRQSAEQSSTEQSYAQQSSSEQSSSEQSPQG